MRICVSSSLMRSFFAFASVNELVSCLMASLITVSTSEAACLCVAPLLSRCPAATGRLPSFGTVALLAFERSDLPRVDIILLKSTTLAICLLFGLIRALSHSCLTL